MKPLRNLLNRLAAEETGFRETVFLAPCIPDCRVRTRIAGLIHVFRPLPSDFEGWGLLQPAGEGIARVRETAAPSLVRQYLERFTPLRARLVGRLSGQTWLAYPLDESEARHWMGVCRPTAVHLVSEGCPFDPIFARNDGRMWWFERLAPDSGTANAEALRGASAADTSLEELSLQRLSPECRAAYDLHRQLKRCREGPEKLLGAARQPGSYAVTWITGEGALHRSVLTEREPEPLTSGICLLGQDRRFDLLSLVGVIERRDRVF